MRLGIFLFYDISGVSDEYVEILLASMQHILHKLVIIINGIPEKKSYYRLKRYSGHIYIRENRGFDAGGYRDAFTRFLTREDLEDFHEIILFNDTFYGPVYPWDAVFKKMEQETVDFWGLTRCPGGRFPTGEKIAQHIQGYFLVCRKRMFTSSCWMEFWNQLEYPGTVREAVLKFETGFTHWFIKNGFICRALSDSLEVPYGCNPYIDRPYELIRYAGVPVIKRKLFSLGSFSVIQKLMEYVTGWTDYDACFIYRHLWRLQEAGAVSLLPPYDPDALAVFYYTYDRIFIYGHGRYGQYLAGYFEYKNWNYAGFIVTESADADTGVYEFGQMSFQDGDGVILALARAACEEVYPSVRRVLEAEQIFVPMYEK